MLKLVAAMLWQMLHRIWRASYRWGWRQTVRSPLPVISVGNISLGGSGKTPFVLFLADLLERQFNKRALILTRGYRGALESGYGVLEGGMTSLANPKIFGDEPVMMAQKSPFSTIIIGKRRAANLTRYLNSCQFQSRVPLDHVVLLDDGFQHLLIERDLNILLIDATLPLSAYHPFPLGRLRESLAEMRAADLVVITKSNQVDRFHLRALMDLLKLHMALTTPLLQAHYQIRALCRLNRTCVAPEQVRGQRFVVMSGLANPTSLFRSVEDLGGIIVAKQLYADHHAYQLKEVEQALLCCEQEQAWLLVSEKDAVKIAPLVQDERIYFLDLLLTMPDLQDQETLRNLLSTVVLGRNARN